MSSEQCDTRTCVRPLGHSGWHKDTVEHFELENGIKVTPKPVDRKPVNDLPTGTGEFDAVARPSHYNAQVPPTDKHPNGIECIDVIMHFELAVGNAMKYLWRAGQKGDYIEDLDKAIAFIEFAKYKELERRKREA